jgi:hypothetical protein
MWADVCQIFQQTCRQRPTIRLHAAELSSCRRCVCIGCSLCPGRQEDQLAPLSSCVQLGFMHVCGFDHGPGFHQRPSLGVLSFMPQHLRWHTRQIRSCLFNPPKVNVKVNVCSGWGRQRTQQKPASKLRGTTDGEWGQLPLALHRFSNATTNWTPLCTVVEGQTRCYLHVPGNQSPSAECCFLVNFLFPTGILTPRWRALAHATVTCQLSNGPVCLERRMHVPWRWRVFHGNANQFGDLLSVCHADTV